MSISRTTYVGHECVPLALLEIYHTVRLEEEVSATGRRTDSVIPEARRVVRILDGGKLVVAAFHLLNDQPKRTMIMRILHLLPGRVTWAEPPPETP